MITAYLAGEIIQTSSQEAFALYEKSRFGEKNNRKVEYSWMEALYLLASSQLALYVKNKILDFDQALAKAKRYDKRAGTKLAVFKNLRQRGYVVKTALKFGADFRIYKKGVKPGQDHALWLAYAVRESEGHSWHEFAAKNRVAHSTKKKLLIGIVDEENDVTYYEVSWVKP